MLFRGQNLLHDLFIVVSHFLIDFDSVFTLMFIIWYNQELCSWIDLALNTAMKRSSMQLVGFHFCIVGHKATSRGCTITIATVIVRGF